MTQVGWGTFYEMGKAFQSDSQIVRQSDRRRRHTPVGEKTVRKGFLHLMVSFCKISVLNQCSFIHPFTFLGLALF